jgi:hypothetical protein
MQEISRAILLPPPTQFSPRANARALQVDPESGVDTARGSTRRESSGAAQSFLTLVDSRREDTVEIKGRQFRFRPYTARGAADADVREAQADAAAITRSAPEGNDEDAAVETLDGFGAGPHERNSSVFIASFIAQQRLAQGLHNPPFAAASDAYRRAGGSPSMIDNQPRVVSVEV